MLFTRNKIFISFLFLPLYLFSGNTDSIINLKKNSTTQYFTANQFEYSDSAKYISNSLYNFQNYTDKTHLGNSGLPFHSLYFQPGLNSPGFNYSKNNFQNYFYTPENLKFYNTRTPYTDLFYVIGTKAEHFFKMTFSYNVKKNWNVTANFHRIRSTGFYKRTSTNNNFIAVSSNYRSNNNRYYFLAGIFYNNIKNNENGGIVVDSVFETQAVIDKQLIDVHLLSAKRKTVNRSIYFKQYLNFGKKSTDTAAHNSIIPGSRLILTTLFDDNVMNYEDENPRSGFYSDIFYDSTKTFDSIYHLKIENELAWKRVDNKKHRGIKDMIGAELNVKHQFIHVHQRETDTTFNNIIAGTNFYNTYSNNKLWWKISGRYAVNGYNKDDYSAAAIIKKGILDSLSSVSLKLETKQEAADFIYQRFSSNNFKWNNHFEQMQEKRMGINFTLNKYDLFAGIDYSQYSNVLYFDNYATAKQYNGSIAVLSVYLKKDIQFYKWHLNNTINYQYVPDSMVIRLPQFILEHSLYYESNAFKGAMLLQIGASVFYTSEYYANAYMPATAQFYLQNDKKYGGYPFIDFFVNARIQMVRIFFKIDHLNYGWAENKSMLTPNYPMNDRAFKLGVSWRFFD